MNEQDLQAIAEHIYRYAPCKPKLAMDRLMNIELIRNTYTKGTLFNMLQGTRRILKDGKIKSGMPKWLADKVLALAAKEPAPQAEPAMDVPQTPYEKYTKLTKDYEQVQNFINEQIEKLEKAKKEYDKSCDDKIQYWNRQIILLGSEYRKLSEEILKGGLSSLLYNIDNDDKPPFNICIEKDNDDIIIF